MSAICQMTNGKFRAETKSRPKKRQKKRGSEGQEYDSELTNDKNAAVIFDKTAEARGWDTKKAGGEKSLEKFSNLKKRLIFQYNYRKYRREELKNIIF